MRSFHTLALALALAAIPAAGHAAVMSVGNSDASACYRAAELRDSAALAACDRALDTSLSRRDRVATLVNRGIVKMWTGDDTAAIADFDGALALNADFAEAKVNKAIALVRIGGSERAAIVLLDAGLAARVSRPEVAFYARGMAHEVLGDTAAAYRDYRRAAELKPGWEEPVRQLTRFTVRGLRA